MNNFRVDDSFPDVNEEILLLFVAHCFHVLRLRYSTIKLYLSGIRFCYLQAGKYNPLCQPGSEHLYRLQTILRGIKKIQGSNTNKRLPITQDILREMCKILRLGLFSPFTDILLEAMFSVAFFAFLRCGELTCKNVFDPDIHLTMSDVVFHPNEDCVNLTLKSSKTDPFRQGVTIRLFKTGEMICPVTAINRYLSSLPTALKEGKKPLFVNNNLQPITRLYFIDKLKRVLQHMGLDTKHYSGHSFRVGAASSCSANGVPDHLIQTLGRWSSDCYMRYIRTSISSLARAQKQMCGNVAKSS